MNPPPPPTTGICPVNVVLVQPFGRCLRRILGRTVKKLMSSRAKVRWGNKKRDSLKCSWQLRLCGDNYLVCCSGGTDNKGCRNARVNVKTGSGRKCGQGLDHRGRDGERQRRRVPEARSTGISPTAELLSRPRPSFPRSSASATRPASITDQSSSESTLDGRTRVVDGISGTGERLRGGGDDSVG
jgi:hypothetical protein